METHAAGNCSLEQYIVAVGCWEQSHIEDGRLRYGKDEFRTRSRCLQNFNHLITGLFSGLHLASKAQENGGYALAYYRSDLVDFQQPPATIPASLLAAVEGYIAFVRNAVYRDIVGLSLDSINRINAPLAAEKLERDGPILSIHCLQGTTEAVTAAKNALDSLIMQCSSRPAYKGVRNAIIGEVQSPHFEQCSARAKPP